MSLSLNCLVLGDDPEKTFTVEIPKNKNIYELKRLIKEKKCHHLNYFDARQLRVWQVSVPIDNLKAELGNINLADAQTLFPLKKLTEFFEDVAKDSHSLHVIAKAPGMSQRASL
jgi:hypothetical protein